MRSVASLAEFERALEAAVRRYDGPAPISSQIRHHFSTAGTRVRALAVLAVAQAEGADSTAALDAACAIEILHQYWNVHDEIASDVRDHAGRATIYARWGLAHGVNAGDSLCAIGYLTLLASDVPRPAERTLAMTRVLHQANFAMCQGAASDIVFAANARMSREDYLTMIGGKTAALVGAACELGALAAGAAPERARAYADLGASYGCAHQIETDTLERSCPRALGALGSAESARAEIRRRKERGDLIARDCDIDRMGDVRAFLRTALGVAA